MTLENDILKIIERDEDGDYVLIKNLIPIIKKAKEELTLNKSNIEAMIDKERRTVEALDEHYKGNIGDYKLRRLLYEIYGKEMYYLYEKQMKIDKIKEQGKERFKNKIRGVMKISSKKDSVKP